MSKITKTIMICENRPITKTFTKRIMVIRQKENKIEFYNVPENNYVDNGKEVFLWSENNAYTYNDEMICIFSPVIKIQNLRSEK